MTLIKGTRGIDVLTGTAVANTIYAFKGNDILKGLGGNDTIFADGGNDSVEGGTGNDSLFGAAGLDTIYGGDGSDWVSGSDYGFLGTGPETKFVDRLFGGAGTDFVTADHKDIALGGTGIDVLSLESRETVEALVTLNFGNIGSAAATAFAAAGTYWGSARAGQFESVNISIGNAASGSQVLGSAGGDFIYVQNAFGAPGPAAGVTIKGFVGNDHILGSGRNDRLEGGIGNDTVRGNQGNDTLMGNAGDDSLFGGSGADVMYGGTGCDTFQFFSYEFGTGPAPRVMDFAGADDILVFALVSTSLNFGDETNLLRKGAVVTNGTTAAGTAQFLYDTDSGALSLDANGSAAGGVTLVATLNGAPLLTASDIWFA